MLSRFVAWMNGLSIFTIKVNNKYSAIDFDDDLRHVMKVKCYSTYITYKRVLTLLTESWMQGRKALLYL